MVQEALKYTIGSKKRKMKWSEIRRLGDFNYNTNVLKEGNGSLIAVRRPRLVNLKVFFLIFFPKNSLIGMINKVSHILGKMS